MYDSYKDKAHFVLVYIREAHPEDGWKMPGNDKADIHINQPTTLGERNKVAHLCTTALSITMPAVVDDIKDSTEIAYGGWPERMFVLDPDGKILYRGAKGPMGFHADEAEKALRKALGMPEDGGVAGGGKGR